MSEVKRHYIVDESLGGIEREYVEVERRASVGDYVVNLNETFDLVFDKAYKITGLAENYVMYGNIYGIYIQDERGRQRIFWSYLQGEHYKLLSPTNIIRHNGQRYEMVDRKAEVGEKVVAIKYVGNSVKAGDIITVSEANYKDGSIMCEDEAFFDTEIGDQYRVLVPLPSEPSSDPTTPQSPQSTDDIIANLVRRVAELESKVKEVSHKAHNNRLDVEELHETTRMNTDNIRTWAEDYTEFKTKQIAVAPTNVTVTNGLDVEELAQKLAEKILIGGRSL